MMICANIFCSESVRESKESPQEKFNRFVKLYKDTYSFVQGRGMEGQAFLDSAYNNLVKFSEEHPQFKSKIPRKFKVYDDKTGGMKTACDALWKERLNLF